jgi:uncharacterized protein
MKRSGELEQTLAGRLQALEAVMGRYPSALVAFSGGVDSTLLAYVAGRTLPGKVLLVTAESSTYPLEEMEEAKRLSQDFALPHLMVRSEELDIPEFLDNPPDRCYYCKRELFAQLVRIAKERGLAVVFDGNNASDLSDFRPGRRAVEELGVVSPLERAGLTKEDIRALSRHFNLSTSEKPAMACLASRFPYGERITREKLDRVGQVERALRRMGFTQLRVRSHGDLARLEFDPVEMQRAFDARETLAQICRQAGFVHSSLDLTGYRCGSMNEALRMGKPSPEAGEKESGETK